jgi:hypothetical protein
MPLIIHDDVVGSIAGQLLSICVTPALQFTPTGTAGAQRVTYPTTSDPNGLPDPPPGDKLVFALANSAAQVEIRAITLAGGLPTINSGTLLAEEEGAALTVYDRYPDPTAIGLYYYAKLDENGDPDFKVKIHPPSQGTGLDEDVWQTESPFLMLVHLMAHGYTLVSGTFDTANPEDLALDIENVFRARRLMGTRVDSHIQSAVTYDLGGCGC